MRLRDYGMSLEAGETYQWLVALVPDPIRRSNDVIVGGAIALVEPAINTVAYYLHERVWARMHRADQRATDGPQHYAAF